MIIEAGYDVLQVLAPEILRRHQRRNAMWVMAMDDQLRYLYTAKVEVDPAASWEDRGPHIAEALRRNGSLEVRYFVIGQIDLSRACGDSHVHRDELAVASNPELKAYELLGIVVSHGRDICSSVPRYSFRDYLGLEHLPRPALCPGPHAWGTCACLACTQFNAVMARNRARARAREAVVAD